MKSKQYLNKIASFECVNCGTHPVEIHHLREGVGMAQRNSDFLTVPLCPECHRGPRGIHGDRSAFRLNKLDEMKMLALTIERVVGEMK